MQKEKIEIPHENEFRNWLSRNQDGTDRMPPSSVSSNISRLRRFFANVFDVFFPKTKKNKPIRTLHEIFIDLDRNNPDTALKLLDALRGLAFDKKSSNQKTSIDTAPYGDCRAALNRYIEFYDEYNRNNNVDGTLPDSIEQTAVEDFIKTYQKKEWTKKELYDNIKLRRTTEGRYTGDVYYPIELINSLLKKNIQYQEWLDNLVGKIMILYNSKGNSITLSELKDNGCALEIAENRNVYVFDKKGKRHMVYTHIDNNKAIKPLKVSIFGSIDIDHTHPISKMLNPMPCPTPHPYPELKELTELINNDPNFPRSRKKEQVKYLRNVFYKENEDVLRGMIESILKDLSTFLLNVEFEMMDGYANKKKSNN